MTQQVRAEVITIGDEILYGQITDTNSQYISAGLSKYGIKTICKTSVGDEKEDILAALELAMGRADVIITTGGLGPTKDDITKQVFCTFLKVPLVLHEPTLIRVKAFFEKRGRELTEINRKQAEVPEGCIVLTNHLGTAPGMWFNYKGKVLISLPGVPYEMKALLDEQVLPELVRVFHPPVIIHKMIYTSGIGESFLAEKIEAWEDALPKYMKLAYLPSVGQVKLRITATGKDRILLQDEVNEQAKKVLPLIGEYLTGTDEDARLEEVLGRLMREKHLTIAFAESCTGGYLSHLFTLIPGSSDYVKGGIIAYSNEVKVAELGVKRTLIEEFGAVSEEVVKAMAEGVRKKLGTDIGVATSGIAGPGGGTPEKPVGTVWIALSYSNNTEALLLKLGTEREINIKATAVQCMNLLRSHLRQF